MVNIKREMLKRRIIELQMQNQKKQMNAEDIEKLQREKKKKAFDEWMMKV